jgi:hypothetical protein
MKTGTFHRENIAITLEVTVGICFLRDERKTNPFFFILSLPEEHRDVPLQEHREVTPGGHRDGIPYRSVKRGCSGWRASSVDSDFKVLENAARFSIEHPCRALI